MPLRMWSEMQLETMQLVLRWTGKDGYLDYSLPQQPEWRFEGQNDIMTSPPGTRQTRPDYGQNDIIWCPHPSPTPPCAAPSACLAAHPSPVLSPHPSRRAPPRSHRRFPWDKAVFGTAPHFAQSHRAHRPAPSPLSQLRAIAACKCGTHPNPHSRILCTPGTEAGRVVLSRCAGQQEVDQGRAAGQSC